MKKIFILTYCVLVPLLLTAAEKLMFERFNMDDALPGMDITSLEMMPGGMLRVVTNKGCILVDRDFTVSDGALRGTSDGVVRKKSFKDVMGRTWRFSRFKAGLELTGADGKQCPVTPEILQKEIITDICHIGNRNIAIATNNSGLYFLDLRSGILDNFRRGIPGGNGLPSNHLSSLAYDSATATLWIGSYNSGLAYCRLRDMAVKKHPLLVREDPSGFAWDRFGRMWVSFDGDGIVIYDAAMQELRHLRTESDGLPSNVVTSITNLGDSTMLCATYGAGLFTVGINDYAVSPLPGAGSGSKVAFARANAFDRQGNLWIATFSSGVIRMSPSGDLTDFKTANSELGTDYITSLCVSPDRDSIYVSTGFGLYVFNTVTLKCKPIDFGNYSSGDRPSIRQVAVAADGVIWLAMDDGLRAIGGESRLFFPDVRFQAVVAARDSSIWASADSFIVRIKPDGRSSIFNAADSTDHFCRYSLAVTPFGETVAGCFGSVYLLDGDYLPLEFPAGNERNELLRGFNLWVGVVVFGIILVIFLLLIIRHRRTRVISGLSLERSCADSDSSGGIAISDIVLPDEAFLKKINSIVEDNLSNSDFTIDDFSIAAGMSRSSLYKKMMLLTGQSPLDYLRNRRLDCAHSLLIEAASSRLRLTVGEAAYRVGMSPRQFSRLYKSRFGVLPSQK